MGRAVSWNWELHLSEKPEDWIYPTSIGEFSEGEEGRIQVADGDRKYNIKDQIFSVDEIAVTILLRKSLREYKKMQDWAKAMGDGAIKDVYIVARGAGRDNFSVPDGNPSTSDVGREETMSFILYNCECAMGKKSSFDRQSKTFDSMTYYLNPTDIELYEAPSEE